ncbi:hypothetical protein DL96DRAFT_1123298 [Flagelloscypha sp. PMI_526]|nr:hypothetical protein DL96DRAFT_1123298 [Flagelloscypha sp. PMI_526]
MSYNHPNYRASTSTNPFSLGNGNDQSIFGGSVPLPRVENNSSQHAPSNTISFVFTYERDIMNSSVLGPRGQQYFVVATDSRKHLTPTTIIQSTRGTHARVDWHQPHPTAEWNGVLERQRAGSFLRLTPDQKQRTMAFGQNQFVWAPSNSSLSLSRVDRHGSELIARVTASLHKSTILDISAEAVAQGMLDRVVLAVVLLMSGQPLD